MRAVRHLAVVVVIAGLVSSCGSSSPSASAPNPGATREPTATPSPVPSKVISTSGRAPSPSMTAAPVASGWPVIGVFGTVIGPDGTVFVVMAGPDSDLSVVALDSAGAMRPGWPFRMTRPAYEPSLVAGADESLLVGIHHEDGVGFQLHRIGADGREVAGWPYRDDGASYCSPPVAELRPHSTKQLEAQGMIVLKCTQPDGRGSTIVVIDAAGRIIPGWPVVLDGVGLDSVWGAPVQLGPDGTVYALGTPNDLGEMARFWAYAPDGSLRPGFPVTLESRVAGYLLARDRVLVVSYVARGTTPEGLCPEFLGKSVLSELKLDEQVVPGWPVTAPGWASRPVIGADGTVYYLAGDRFFAHFPDGSVRLGWPVAISPVSPECADYGPYLATDGTVYAMDDDIGLAAFGADGQARPGWPFEPANGFAGWFCTMDAMGGPSPVLGPDGRVYAAVAGARDADGEPGPLQVVALDSGGRVIPGWPYALPGTGRGEVVLHGVVDGRLYVGQSQCGVSDFATALLALDADGSLSD